MISMKVRKVLLATVVFLLFSSICFAGFEVKPEFRWTHLYRYDNRPNKHKLYTNRLAAVFSYLNDTGKALFKIIPFFEIRVNTAGGFKERREAGIEFGKDIFSFLYLGESIQRIWAREDSKYYGQYQHREYMEAETRMRLSHNLIEKNKFKLIGFIYNDFTFDMDRNEGLRNELGFGFDIPIGKHLETTFNWRHIDRIHFYDSDILEGSLTLIF